MNRWNQTSKFDSARGDPLAEKRELPLVVLEVLDQFGIAPEKATYVCEMLTEDYCKGS